MESDKTSSCEQTLKKCFLLMHGISTEAKYVLGKPIF